MHALTATAGGFAKPVERVAWRNPEPLRQHADGLLDDDPRAQGVFQLADLDA